MKQHAVSGHVDAAPGEVFEILAQPIRIHLTHIHLLDAAVVGTQTRGVGTVYRWQYFFPFTGHVWFEEEVTQWEEGRRIRTRARSTHHLETELVVVPEEGGARVEVSVVYATPRNALLTAAVDRLVRYLSTQVLKGVAVSLQRRSVLATAL